MPDSNFGLLLQTELLFNLQQLIFPDPLIGQNQSSGPQNPFLHSGFAEILGSSISTPAAHISSLRSRRVDSRLLVNATLVVNHVSDDDESVGEVLHWAFQQLNGTMQEFYNMSCAVISIVPLHSSVTDQINALTAFATVNR